MIEIEGFSKGKVVEIPEKYGTIKAFIGDKNFKPFKCSKQIDEAIVTNLTSRIWSGGNNYCFDFEDSMINGNAITAGS